MKINRLSQAERDTTRMPCSTPDHLAADLAYAVTKKPQPTYTCDGAVYTLIDFSRDGRFLSKGVRYEVRQSRGGLTQGWRFGTLDEVEAFLSVLVADLGALAVAVAARKRLRPYDPAAVYRAAFPADLPTPEERNKINGQLSALDRLIASLPVNAPENQKQMLVRISEIRAWLDARGVTHQ